MRFAGNSGLDGADGFVQAALVTRGPVAVHEAFVGDAAGGDGGASFGPQNNGNSPNPPTNKAPPQRRQPPQTKQPSAKPCTPSSADASRSNNPNVYFNIGTGAMVGFTVTGVGVGGAILICNIALSPECEFDEGLGILGALTLDPLGTAVTAGTIFGSYGAVGGGIVGFAATSRQCP